MAIPNYFTTDHVLPPGDFTATFADLRASILVNGAGSPNWDMPWRSTLVDKLELLVNELWSVGITEIFIDGSFVEDKDHPGDIDGYFEVDPNTIVQQVTQLNKVNPRAVWNWNAHTFPGSPKLMLAMRYFYQVELYPHVGQNSGIPGPGGLAQTFPEAFRRTRMGTDKGIIKLIP